MNQILKMKRILAILTLVLLLAGCSTQQNPVIKDYRLRQSGEVGFGAAGVTAGLVLEVDVANPSASRYTLESLEAVLYRGFETSPFADLTMPESVFIEPRSEATVPIPLTARFTRPLALLSGSFSTDLNDYTADIDLTIRKGSLKKRITRERVPLTELTSLFPQDTKTESHEKE